MGEYFWQPSMTVDCNEDDVDEASFERRSIVDFVHVVSSKSGNMQSRSFEAMLCAGCRSGQSGRAGYARGLMPWGESEHCLW